jgi:UDP-glucose:(heptosyl)LPS alpha-1,3-glucosyltransferase
MTRPDAPVVLCLSDYVKRSIRRDYSLPDKKLATLFNAVDLTRFCPVQRAPGDNDEVSALLIANDFERKGLATAIEAMGRLKDQPIRLLVAGKEDPANYRRFAEQRGAAVELTGAVADPRPLYQEADFFVLPTRHDPCSLVVLEALAMGVPVISTRFNGACEIMTDGVHGYILDDPNDVPALEAAMRKMLDPLRREQMRQACLALRPKLSFEHHVETLLSIYRDVSSVRNATDPEAASTHPPRG